MAANIIIGFYYIQPLRLFHMKVIGLSSRFQFMGKWYEVAVASTCPHYMRRKRGNPITVALELKPVRSGGNFTMAATTLRSDSRACCWTHSFRACHNQYNLWCVCVSPCRNGSCWEASTDYSLTTVPGRFFHHVASMLSWFLFMSYTPR